MYETTLKSDGHENVKLVINENNIINHKEREKERK